MSATRGASPPPAPPSHPPDLDAPRVHVIERAGCPIHAWSSGPPDAPTVVLTHGVTIDHGTFATQVPLLVGAGYRVVTWDLRAHGRSRPMGERFTIARAADDLHALLDELAIVQAVLVGQSFGGFVVQELHRRHPHRVAGLVLAGGLPLGAHFPAPLRAIYRLLPRLHRVWPERHLRSLVPPFMSRRADVQAYVEAAIRPLERADFAMVSEAATEGLLAYAAAPRVDVPVLCLMGDAEMAIVTRSVRAWAARMPLVSLAVVEGAAHLANQENPRGFVRELLAFTEGLVRLQEPPRVERSPSAGGSARA